MNTESFSFDNFKPTEELKKEFQEWVIAKGYVQGFKLKPKRSGTIWMVTVTKPLTDNFSELKKFTTNSPARKKWIKRYWYCYELQKNGNPHSHILIETHTKMQKNRVEKGFVHKGWNIQIDSWDTIDKGLTYLEGRKKGTWKPMHDSDILFRQKNKLLDIYTHGAV